MDKIHFCNTHIAGFSYWDGAEVFSELQIGSELVLKREIDNRFDVYAVAIFFKEFKLGYLPREENREISKLLDAGYVDAFVIRINRISCTEHPENQIGIVIHLKHK